MDYKKKFEEGISYERYMQEMLRFKTEGKSSSFNQKVGYAEYTSLSYHRMKRLNKTLKLSESLGEKLDELKTPIHMLAITESWCGDAAQNLPLFDLLSSYSDQLNLKLVYREENLDLMDEHLTDGGRSIPVVIFLDDNFQRVAQWGPRPRPIQEFVKDYKSRPEPKEAYEEFQKKTQQLYNHDGGKTLSLEIENIIDQLLSRNCTV
ncbi:thioredoxin family protein [Luteibaculum oceani]|uniref:Thioredoxin family protein n=1 Tax=Luteibaculum oceani TaxID=1294296 RepID=A0A5C6V940_9FLAO|nr:thioredoxin family protein [Luteibaculum oceani]TXC81659.1 thioredoxin family protein [Luteibaculum oceani]